MSTGDANAEGEFVPELTYHVVLESRLSPLEWAVKGRQGPLHISLPGPESATVVFEKE